MDEEVRKSRVLAGKEAFKAYQKKKKKTKSKTKHTDPTDVSSSEKDASSKSEPSSLNPGLNYGAGAADTTGENVSGNASPIPFDDFGNPHMDDNLSLPHEFSSRMSTSLPIIPPSQQSSAISDHPNQYQFSNPVSSENRFRPTVEHSDQPDGVADRHASPLPPDSLITETSPDISKLEQELVALRASKQQLQNELNAALDLQHQAQNEVFLIRKNQDSAIEMSKRELASTYQSQIASLQHSLMQSESSQQDMEKQLSDLRSAHNHEVEKLLRTQEEIRVAMLAEKDQKHASHVVRLTSELSSQLETADVSKDADEQEAERLRMIKSKMREMFDEEKKQIMAEHQREKVALQQGTQKQLEDYRTQTEHLANAKLQEVHAQFMSAHQALQEQKNQADVQVQELSSKLDQVHFEIRSVSQEKSELQQRYDQLSESHLTEIEEARRASTSLESRLDDWKNKASNLEARLQNTQSQTQTEIEQLREQNQSVLKELKLNYEEKMNSLQGVVDDYEKQLQQMEAEKHDIVENFKQSQVDELEKIKSSHSSEIGTLNESIRELSADKGSLEAAEEHMQSVQKQLETYRTQERSFQTKLDEKEQQYREGIEAHRQQFESEKLEAVEQVSSKFASKIERLEQELASLTELMASEDSDTKHHEQIESLKQQHCREMSELQTTLYSSQELAVKKLREELEKVHAEQFDALVQEHSEEIAEVKDDLNNVWLQKIDAEKADLIKEYDESKTTEIERLRKEHSLALEGIGQSASDTEATASLEAQERISVLEKELQTTKDECSQREALQQDLLSQLEFSQRQAQDLNQTLTRTNVEMERISQDCDRYQNKNKSLEVDLSISQSAHEQDKLQLSSSQQKMAELQSRTEQLQVELEELKASESASVKNEKQLLKLTDNLASKNVALADLQAQNDTLNTEVFSLTQKCQQYIAKSSSLQEQLETSWGVNEEIDSLKQRVAELSPLKQECTDLKQKTEGLEGTLVSKDEQVMSLQSQLEQAMQYVTEATGRCSDMQKSMSASAAEIERLKNEVATKESQEEDLHAEVDDYQQQVRDLTTKYDERECVVAELNRTVENLQSQLSSTAAEFEKVQKDNSKLKNDVLQSQQSFMAVSKDEYREPYERLQEEFETEKDRFACELSTLQKQLEQAANEQNQSWERKATELEEQIQNLTTKLAAKESAFSEMQNEFGRQLNEAELREKSLRAKMNDPSNSQEQLGSVLKEKSALEETLSKARQSLVDKLAEKSSLEKELSVHRTELERRMSEKQRLEELLFEKSRFEQELQSQKEHLQSELEVIESKLKLKEVDHSRERNQLLGKVREKENVIDTSRREHQAKEKQLRQKQSKEIERLHNDLSFRHSTELSQQCEGLKNQHKQAVGVLEARHKKELEEQHKEITSLCEGRLSDLRSEIDERRLRELSTVKEVLQREKENDLRDLEARLNLDLADKLKNVRQDLENQFQIRLDKELAAREGSLQQTHQLHTDALMAGISDETQHQYQVQLEHLSASHQEEIQRLKSQHETVISELNDAHAQSLQEELTQQLKQAEESFVKELAEKLSGKEEELATAFELRLAQSNSSWETKLDESLEACRSELVSKYEGDIKQLKSLHSEEMDNALKACQNACDEQIEALKYQHKNEHSSALMECETALRKQYTEQLTALENSLKQKHQEEVQQLFVEKEELSNSIESDKAKLLEEIASLQSQVSELEHIQTQLKDKQSDVVERELRTKEEDLQEQFRADIADLNATHSAAQQSLGLEYENKITSLQSELEAVQEQLEQKLSEVKLELQQAHSREILGSETKHHEEIAEVQSNCEQKLHESELAHIEEVNQLGKEYLEKENSLLLCHEQKCQGMLQSHEQEKAKLITKYESDVNELHLAQSKRLTDLRAEVLQASEAADKGFSQRLEKHLKEQEQVHDSHLKSAVAFREVKLRQEFSTEIDTLKSDLVEEHVESLAQVQTEATLKTASKLEQLRLRFIAEREEASKKLKQQIFSQQEQSVHQGGSPGEVASLKSVTSLSTQVDTLKAEYEATVADLESSMASERKTQLDLLKEKYESDWAETEQRLRAELEEEHMKHVEQVITECSIEKEKALGLLKQELELALQESIFELESCKREHLVELENIQAQHSSDIKNLQSKYTADIDSLHAQQSGEHDSNLEQVRAQLVREHMTKFKEMTEKLQQVHQSELESLRQEREHLLATHEQDLHTMSEELENKHHQDLSELTEGQKRELNNLHELYESRLRQTEVDHAHRIRSLIEQQDTQEVEREGLEQAVKQELSKLNEDLERKLLQLETERQEYTQHENSLKEELEQAKKDSRDALLEKRQVEEKLERVREETKELNIALQARDRQLTEMNEHHAEQIRLVEEGMISQLGQLQTQLQTAVTEREERSKVISSLKTENESLLETVNELNERNTQLSQEIVALSGQFKSEVNQFEDGDTVARLSSEFNTLQAERDLLQSTVTALYGAIVNSLELSNLINSVLGTPSQYQPSSPTQHHLGNGSSDNADQLNGALLMLASVNTHGNGHHSDLEERGESDIALPERLLASQVSPSGSVSVHSMDDGPTPTHTPHRPPLTSSVSTSTSTVSSVSPKYSSEWTDMKQTPSVDSGVISQQTSVLQSDGSTVVGTPSVLSSSNLATATPTVITTPSSLATSTHDVGSISTLSIVPLDTTLSAGNVVNHDDITEGLDMTAPSFLSVSLMTTASPTHGHQEEGGEDYDDTMESLTEQPMPDLSMSVLPLDVTSQSNQLSSLDHQPGIHEHQTTPLPDLANLHFRLIQFHSSISTLVQRHATLISQSQVNPSGSQSTISHLQFQLSSLLQRHRELQSTMEESKNRERERELQIEQQLEELAEKSDQLDIADTKIKSLVQQLEGEGAKVENELIEETQALIDTFKARESLEGDLKTQLLHAEGQLEERERLVQQLQADNETLLSKVSDLTNLREDSQSELEHLKADVLQNRQENQALKNVNRQLRGQQEQLDIKFRTLQESTAQLTSHYETHLKEKQDEIQELEDVKDCLAAKEEFEERLMSEKEELANRLSVVEHQLATQREARRFEEERRSEENDSAQREEHLLKELRGQSEVCETLRARLEEAQSNLHFTSQELAQIKSVKSQLQLELQQLREEFQRKETTLQNTVADKVAQDKTLESCREELDCVREELEAVSAQKEEMERQLDEVRAESQRRAGESQTGLTDDSSLTDIDRHDDTATSETEENVPQRQHQEQQLVLMQTALDAKSNELEDLTVTKIHLEDKLASVEDEMREREEDRSLQISNLEQELTNLRQQLTEQVRDLELQRNHEERKGSKVKIDQLERHVSELEAVVNDLSHKISLETKLKDSLAEEVSALRSEVERGQRSREVELIEVDERHEQQLQAIVTEHAQKLNELQLAHLEALHRQRGELNAQHAGEMAFIKLQHQEQVEELQTQHSAEVEHIVSDHHTLLSALDNPGARYDESVPLIGDDLTSEALLLKIAELAPVLAREAQEVNELCRMTGQVPAEVDGHTLSQSSAHNASLRALADRLKEIVDNIGAAKDTSGVEDWRKDLLQAVENLLQHERDLLSTTLSASSIEREGDSSASREYQKLLQDQLSQHTVLLQQLHSADRESLLAEIRELRATLETMRREQKQQNQDLLAQLQQAQSGQPSNTIHLKYQLDSAHSALSELERELANRNEELVRRENEKMNLETNLESLTDVRNRLQQELATSRERVREVEQSLGRATATISSLQKELQSSKDLSASLENKHSTDELSSDQLRESLTSARSHNQQLSAEVQRLNNQLVMSSERLSQTQNECGTLQQTVNQLQSGISQANQAVGGLKLALQNKQGEIENLLSREQQADSALRSKEAELTQTTDQLLREKVVTSRANGETIALRDRLSAFEAEIDGYQQQIAELHTLREQLNSLRRDYQELGSKFEMSEQERRQMTRSRNESEAKYKELIETLQSQLRRSKLIQNALDQQVTSGGNVRELLETLLHQEHLQSLSNEAVQADKEHLERQIGGLKKEIEDWKRLAKTTVPHGLSPVQSSELLKTRSNDVAAQYGPGYEQAIENANSKIVRLYAQYRQAETHRKALVFQKRYLLCQVDAFYQTQQAALVMMADMGAPMESAMNKPHCTNYSRPYARFRVVGRVVLATLRIQYVRRRKIEYLQAKMNKLSPSPSSTTTFGFSPPTGSTQQHPHLILSKSNDRASHTSNPLVSSHPAPIFSLSSKIQPSESQPRPTSVVSTKESGPDVVKRPKLSSIDSLVQGRPTHHAPLSDQKSGKRDAGVNPSRSSSKHKRVLSQNHVLPNTPTPLSASRMQSSTKTSVPKQSKLESGKPSLKKFKPPSSSGSSRLPVPGSSGDPQLLAYMKGLERLQARLSKTKL